MDPSLSTGIRHLDREHRSIFRAVELLLSDVERAQDEQVAREIMSYAARYAPRENQPLTILTSSGLDQRILNAHLSVARGQRWLRHFRYHCNHHYLHEEATMERIGYSGIGRHADAHADVAAYTLNVSHQLQRHGPHPELLDVSLRLLANVHMEHIRTEDKAFAEVLQDFRQHRGHRL